jgi:carboxylesterase
MRALRRGLIHAPLEVIRLENSYHVATMDNDAPEIFRGSADFIRSLAAAGTPDARASQKDTADD